MSLGYVGQKVNQYTIKERKGSGMNVYLGNDETSKKEVIVKVFGTNLDGSQQKSFDMEIKVGMRISHNCIFLVQYEEVIMKKDLYFVIMEYCKKGDLAQLISHHLKNNEPFTDDEILRVIFHVGSGVQMLHAENIVHRDLKPENIFQTENEIFKVGDFGISRDLSNKPTSVMASIGYASPEILDGDEKVSKAMDIYSLGCILLEIIDMRHPFANEKNVVQQSRVFASSVNPPRPSLTASMKSVRDYALQMVSKNPDARPSVEGLLALPAVLSFGCRQYVRSLGASSAGVGAESLSAGALLKEENVEVLKEKNQQLQKERDKAVETNTVLLRKVAELEAAKIEEAGDVSLPLKFLVNSYARVANTGSKLIWNSDCEASFFVGPEMNKGCYKIVIEAQGKFTNFRLGLAVKDILDKLKTACLDDAQAGSCLIWTGGIGCVNKDLFKGKVFSSPGWVTLGLELDADQHVLYFFVDERQIPHCVVGIPSSVHFGVSGRSKGLTIELTELSKLAKLSVSPSLVCAKYQWR